MGGYPDKKDLLLYFKKLGAIFMGEVEHLTREGFEKLKKELETLRTEKRMEISEKIRVARSFGDLSENSEYEEAKNEQGIVEARIKKIEEMLKNVKIIDQNEISLDIVSVGSTVKIKNINSGKISTYKIVGTSESNPKKGRISDSSPVGKGLIGHNIGEKVNVKTPVGIIDYEILQIEKV